MCDQIKRAIYVFIHVSPFHFETHQKLSIYRRNSLVNFLQSYNLIILFVGNFFFTTPHCFLFTIGGRTLKFRLTYWPAAKINSRERVKRKEKNDSAQ